MDFHYRRWRSGLKWNFGSDHFWWRSFENLRLDNSSNVDITDPADLFGVLFVDQVNLNTGGNLTLRCGFDSEKTAQVGPVVGIING